MALIKIEGRRTSISIYSLPGFISFAFCSSPKDGRKQCNGFTTCKAFLHDNVRMFLSRGRRSRSGHYYSGYKYKEDPKIDMDKLRLLVARDFGASRDFGEKKLPAMTVDQFKKNLRHAQRVINFYEKTAGWTKSRVLKVDHSLYKNVWLVTGPKQWMQAPQLISMITLILRTCVSNGPIKFKTNEDLEEVYKTWVRDGKKDFVDLWQCYDKMFILSKFNGEIFEGISLEDLYPDIRKNVAFHTNGIATLSQFKSVTQELNKRFKEICKREKVDVESRSIIPIRKEM